MFVCVYIVDPNSSQRQKALTGRVDMKPSSVVKVPQDESPKIIGPHRVKVKAHPGEQLFLHCEAFTNCKDVTLIYWLVNGSFPEDLLSSGRILESEESTLDNGAILQRSLMLKNVTSEDLKSTFTCVVTNASGMVQKNIVLVARGKRRRH
ncbi:interleukin-18-binding protein-like isoform X2 [Anarrhichthys ocellatus]|uniref:interleukin-18-binding protein-like isoform X2 n=1 Tax=Anarrhichthys ocellatus TaxID=433405 RepID=UPI0012ED8B7B|nr:interleukin-18-binding protein-like isoform X2 [Anarrhichthys ocellatus]